MNQNSRFTVTVALGGFLVGFGAAAIRDLLDLRPVRRSCVI